MLKFFANYFSHEHLVIAFKAVNYRAFKVATFKRGKISVKRGNIGVFNFFIHQFSQEQLTEAVQARNDYFDSILFV